MKIETKSSVLILAIFIFGIICGFFLRSMFNPGRPPMPQEPNHDMNFTKRIEDKLQLNNGQLKNVEPIIKKYDKKLFEALDRARFAGMTVMDSLKVEIAPYLNEKQKEILNDELNHFNNPPPPDRPMQ